jgi:hypothetical protein
MEAEKILALLDGRDSRNQMPFDELVLVSGIDPSSCSRMLDAMFHRVPALVNRAQITRADKTQMVYWPTGVIEKFDQKVVDQRSWNQRVAMKAAEAAPYRRDETKPAQPKQENEMAKTKQRPQPKLTGKSCGRIFLEYLAEHNTATGKELCALTGQAESVGAYLTGPIKRGHVIVERLGQSVRSGNRYTVAPGITREMLLADARKKNVPPHEYKAMQEAAAEEPIKSSEATPEVESNLQSETANTQPENADKPVSTADIPAPAAYTMQSLIEQLQTLLPQHVTLVLDRASIDIESHGDTYTCTAAEAERTIESLQWLETLSGRQLEPTT